MDIIREVKLLISVIGVLESLLNESISIDESEKLLFSPKTIKNLLSEQCDRRIISIIEECCELEDINSLLPQKLKKNLILLKNRALILLKDYDVTEEMFKVGAK